MLGWQASFSWLINTEISLNTHMYTHSHFSLGGQRTKSLLKLTFEQKFNCCRSKTEKKKKQKSVWSVSGITGFTETNTWRIILQWLMTGCVERVAKVINGETGIESHQYFKPVGLFSHKHTSVTFETSLKALAWYWLSRSLQLQDSMYYFGLCVVLLLQFSHIMLRLY